MRDCNLAKRNIKIQANLQSYLKKIRAKLYIRKMAQRFRENIYLKSISFHRT